MFLRQSPNFKFTHKLLETYHKAAQDKNMTPQELLASIKPFHDDLYNKQVDQPAPNQRHTSFYMLMEGLRVDVVEEFQQNLLDDKDRAADTVPECTTVILTAWMEEEALILGNPSPGVRKIYIGKANHEKCRSYYVDAVCGC